MAKPKARGNSMACPRGEDKRTPKRRSEPGRERRTKERLTGRRLWSARIAMLFMAPLLVLVLLELALHLCGVGRPAAFFIPSHTPGVLTTNEWYVWFYHHPPPGSPHPCLIRAEKPKDTIRIFVLGESAAMGTPDPSFGFARILEFMLQTYYPQQHIEVINAAVRGINSHMVRAIAEECATLKPDVFLVYMGNNELCGLYGPHSLLGKYPSLIPAVHTLKKTHLAQWLTLQIKGHPSELSQEQKTQTEEFFRTQYIALADPAREPVYTNFQNNLNAICRSGLDAGASVLVSTIPVNLRDFPPLGSLHRNNLSPDQLNKWRQFYTAAIQYESKKQYKKAIEQYQEAGGIDDRYAEIHFRLARCYFALNDKESARTHFILARDLDALPFRTDSGMNAIIRNIVGQYKELPVRLVDTETILSEICTNTTFGSEWFYDHVHPNFKGDYKIAKYLLQSARVALSQDRNLAPRRSASIPSMQQCAERLGYTEWNRINAMAAMARMTTHPPFTEQLDHEIRQTQTERQIATLQNRLNPQQMSNCIRDYRTAIATYPEDWHLRYNYATLLYQFQQYPQAIEQIRPVVEKFPEVHNFRMCLGHALARIGNIKQAAQQYARVLEFDPQYLPAQQALEWAAKQSTGRSVATFSD
ncbi:MAG: tetratricopeptide repeat protein [Sedimentisphaerales bacterium]|nr:tetratricopeptide repeat protein [Sedimentisphaerales bacterium]